MTRKRFIKKLMAHGISRNSANDEAAKIVRDGASYEDRYIYVLAEHYRVDHSFVDQLSETIMELIPVIVDAINTAIPRLISEIKRISAGFGMLGC